MSVMSLRCLLALAGFGIIGCKPDLGERESFVDRPRVIAIRVEPPEARPGERVTVSSLVVDPDGPHGSATIQWSFCDTPKLLTENGAVSAACVKDAVTPIAETANAVEATIPERACFAFGPETTSAEVRPRDPDVTGGYFLPIRARARVDAEASTSSTLTAFGFARLVCNLPNASAALTSAFSERYVRNVRPSLIMPTSVSIDGTIAPLDAIPRGARVVVRVSWRPEDAETYALFDSYTQTIETRRESLRASWFTNAGELESDRTGRAENDPETWTENVWSAPDEARTTHIWVVLRDARGGVEFGDVVLTTR